MTSSLTTSILYIYYDRRENFGAALRSFESTKKADEYRIIVDFEKCPACGIIYRGVTFRWTKRKRPDDEFLNMLEIWTRGSSYDVSLASRAFSRRIERIAIRDGRARTRDNWNLSS